MPCGTVSCVPRVSQREGSLQTPLPNFPLMSQTMSTSCVKWVHTFMDLPLSREATVNLKKLSKSSILYACFKGSIFLLLLLESIQNSQLVKVMKWRWTRGGWRYQEEYNTPVEVNGSRCGYKEWFEVWIEWGNMGLMNWSLHHQVRC